MTNVLLATDADHLANTVVAALADGETTINRVRAGADVREATVALEPDLVVLDMQIGNMGGIATSIDLRHEAGAKRVPEVRILMLLDRDADRWIATEAQADHYLVKPVSSLALKRAVSAALA